MLHSIMLATFPFTIEPAIVSDPGACCCCFSHHHQHLMSRGLIGCAPCLTGISSMSLQQDVTALGVGDKTTDKLLEILQTGKLRRNEEVAGSERHQIMALFMG